MYDNLKNATNRVVGFKQLMRELDAGTVQCVYVAEDAEDHLKEKIHGAVEGKDIKVCRTGTMRELGDVCGIEVNAACAAILKE